MGIRESMGGGMSDLKGEASFEIIVDGKSRSFRDQKEVALLAGKFLKAGHPNSEVIVRDAGDNSETVIGWENGAAFVRT
jgi:hypothetical protein